MKLASADFTWPGLRPEFVFDLIAELGLDGVSMAFYGGWTPRTPELIAGDPEGWGERVAGELAQCGLAVADTFCVLSAELTPMAVNHPDPAERARGDALFEPFTRFAGRVGSTGVTVLPGLVFDGEPWQEALERAAEGLRRRVAVASAAGLRCSVEPHIVSAHPYVGSVVDTPEKVHTLLERVPGLELTLDYGHFNVQGIPDREVEPLLAHARHVHLRGGAPGLVQTKFADNVTDVGRIVDVLARHDYDGWIEIEYVHDERPGCSDCDPIQEIQRFRDFLRAHERAAGRTEETA